MFFSGTNKFISDIYKYSLISLPRARASFNTILGELYTKI